MKNNKYLYSIALSVFIVFSSIGFVKAEEKRENIKYIIDRILETDRRNKFVKAEISNYSKGYYKDGKKVSQIVESRVYGKVILRKPYTTLFQVLESTNPMAVGAKLLYKGGKEIKVRASGLFGFIALNFDIDDPMFRNSRNHKFTFDGLGAIRNSKADVTLLSTSEINNKKVYVLKVVSPTKADSEITHEIYKVDAETFVVLSIRMYVNNDMVSEYTINNLDTSRIKGDDIFKI